MSSTKLPHCGSSWADQFQTSPSKSREQMRSPYESPSGEVLTVLPRSRVGR